ncbi:MAG TPA: trypsin-like serine protease [Hyphomicrobiaceae bacterium]|nr:trypsin-like serine protease [Hyphomicrobiaceae bacterium]
MPALGVGLCVSGASAAGAQDYVAENGLMYVKRLDLRLNKVAPADDSDGGAQPAPSSATGNDFHETPIELRALSAPLDDSRDTTRIINGTPSKEGNWQSAVNIVIKRGRPNRAQTYDIVEFGCGASVIGRHWLLTAAHCVFDHKLGGLKTVQWVKAYEGSNQLRRGHLLRVSEIHVHRQYMVTPDEQYLNDLALLKLEKDATAPRQKLALGSGLATFLAEKNMATVVGWGNTDTSAYKPSPVLLQANVPIVSQQQCQSLYPAVGQVAFCAGYPQGGTDTCQGDSGGPLFVAGNLGEPVQVGITSFGRGCAQAKYYGVYTNIGHFEQWIRQRVPDATFAPPPGQQPGSSPLADIAGAMPGGPPAPHGQVNVDIVQVSCSGEIGQKAAQKAVMRSANRLKVGACIKVVVSSGVTGHLKVLSRNADGRIDTIFPNPHSGSKQLGATDGYVRAGSTIALPGVADNFFYSISAPLGRAYVIAIVAAEEVGLPKIAAAHRGLASRTAEEVNQELAEIARQINVHPRAARAIGTRQYEVVN